MAGKKRGYDLPHVISRFRVEGNLVDVGPYGTGHINDTYASRMKTEDGGERRYIHQRINHGIFKDVEKLMENIERVTAHVRRKVTEAGRDPLRASLTLVPTRDGASFYRDQDGNYWRTYVFIEGARTYDVIENPAHVYSAARAFGEFQEMLADLPGERLHEVIPDFHHTAKRFRRFVEVLERDPLNRAAEAKREVDFVLARGDDTRVLVDLLAEGKVPERVTHNDTKFNNVMIDDVTGEGVCVIDLDTVMPGLVMYDFGDAVRIGASTAAEDERDLSKVHMDIELFRRLAHGYLDAARAFLTPLEVEHLAFSAKLMTFECGMRFLTDFLEGDVYFKIHREEHNLDRCRTQFRMVEEMEERMEEMEEIVETYARKG